MTDAAFPVVWDDPSDADVFWTRDRLHYPNQVTPLAFTWSSGTTFAGFGDANAEMGPPTRFDRRLVNTYFYAARYQLPAEPDVLARAMAERERRLDRLESVWDDEYLPEILEHLDYLAAIDLPSLTMDELRQVVTDATRRVRRIWHLHFLVTPLCIQGLSHFTLVYVDLLGGTTLEALKCTQGQRNKTVETGHELWKLSRLVRAGRPYEEDLERYLAAYGKRSDLWGIEAPSWIDDPTPVLQRLRSYSEQDDDSDPAVQHSELESAREAAIHEARSRLRDHSPEDQERFERALRWGLIGARLLEDHGFYIDFRGQHEARRILMEFARRFVDAGVLESEGDVFMLTLDELDETAASAPNLDRRALVAERRAEMERWSDVDPPETIGTPPPRGPKTEAQRQSENFFGARGDPDAPREAGVVAGTPGAPGTARGTARLITTVLDGDRLGEGDVLVAQTTAPPWTPLFAIAAAVVTDTGGPISHCAVVAREYGIPAVVGCGDATKRIKDGEQIEVDGNAGVVRVIV